jgi:hypothetical protein
MTVSGPVGALAHEVLGELGLSNEKLQGSRTQVQRLFRAERPVHPRGVTPKRAKAQNRELLSECVYWEG